MMFMLTVALYSLFGDDIRMVSFKKKDDYVFFWMTSFTMGFFLVEILISSYSISGYFIGFNFWLDLISTLSLLFDIEWIWDIASGTEYLLADNS